MKPRMIVPRHQVACVESRRPILYRAVGERILIGNVDGPVFRLVAHPRTEPVTVGIRNGRIEI